MNTNNMINPLPFGYNKTVALATRHSNASNQAVAAMQKTAFVAGAVFVAIAETVRNIFTGLINAVILPINALHNKLTVQKNDEPVMGIVVKTIVSEEAAQPVKAPPVAQEEVAASNSYMKPALLTLAGLTVAGVAAYYLSGSSILEKCANPFYAQPRLPRPAVNLDQCAPQDFLGEDFRMNHIKSFASDAPYTTQVYNWFRSLFASNQALNSTNSTH